MQFRETQPIYLQIGDYICEKILLEEWKPEDRVPSVRELAVTLEVNPNTVMRTYEYLQQKNIVYNQRGVGLFIAENAYTNTLAYKKEHFTEKDMPFFFRNMVLLQIEPEELESLFKKYKKKNFPTVK
jgi:GntR family transcriptional regulator